MGTWDLGPFDNDAAADWCGDLDEAVPDDRPGIIAMTLVADLADPESGSGEEVVAAAAVVAASLPGAEHVGTSYAPDYLRRGDAVPPSLDTVAAAVAALDRVTGPDSELRSLHREMGELEAWLDGIATLRCGLAGGVT